MSGSHLKLFSSTRIGPLQLSHRVVHAPMTRLRSAADDSPSAMMVEYYRQRASQGGLLITESAHPSYDSRGYLGAPGIYTDAAAGGFDRAGAKQILQRGDADLVAFGRWFSSNPDLPERLRRALPLAPYQRDAFWGGDERAYIDFPAYDNASSDTVAVEPSADQPA
ncbi:hypothetical protein LMG28727_03582 [Paraburkholderia kirstenboschensis]|uniref:oxidoreductase n=1 Tax=Paraburkholderia kirstenboschensis TaxID=1245436 RepID=UPI000B2AD931|nr:hypothetical protein [Paraburkholderia kirstenboschensis]CAD6538893.1 hypothetical protein LMG28727_03582 [Paraburkholderia kirstenboschensis]